MARIPGDQAAPDVLPLAVASAPGEMQAVGSLKPLVGLKAVAGAVRHLAFQIDGDGTIRHFSGETRDLYLAPEHFIGRRMQDVLPPPASQLFVGAIESALRQRQPITIEYELPIRGESLHFEACVVAIHDEVSEPRLLITVRDISELRKTEQALREAENKYRSIFENALEGIFQTTREGCYITVNPRLAQIYGFDSPEDLIATVQNIGSEIYVKPGRREEFQREIEVYGRVENFESQVRRRDGRIIWVTENSRAIYSSKGEVVGYEGTTIETTERRAAEEALRKSETRLRDIIEHSSNLHYAHTTDHVFTYLSPQVRHFLDCEPHEAMVNWTEFLTDNPINEQGFLVCQRAIDTGVAQGTYELELRGRQGRVIWVEVNEAPVVRDGKTVAIVGALVDISQRRSVELQLKHQAFHDALTGLPNRPLFLNRLAHALETTNRRKSKVAVMFLDLDRFKIINDSLGHDVGDQLLKAAAERLNECLRVGDTVARLGGDEFTILMEDVQNVNDTVLVAERVAEALRMPFKIGTHELFVTTSIGVALSRSPLDSPDALLRDADVAMYRAKNKGPAQFEVFDPDMNARALERLSLETDLWHALQRDEFRVFYQPKFEIQSERLMGFEALIRWEHPKFGLVGPCDFIPLAEETGLIHSIGKWVLQESCRQARIWQDARPGQRAIEMSVNLSARQLAQPDLTAEIAATLQESGLSPHSLILEITESVMMNDPEAAIRTLRELKALGVRIAVDDFGMGYSSLAYLRRFPLDHLKIDRAFISRLGQDSEDSAIVQAIITLGRALGLTVTAEGIETQTHLRELRSMECDKGQGFFFSRPLHPDAARELMMRLQQKTV